MGELLILDLCKKNSRLYYIYWNFVKKIRVLGKKLFF